MQTSRADQWEIGSESKAVAFLVREVPAWSKGNGCFSCHNNGDGARALYTASLKGRAKSANAHLLRRLRGGYLQFKHLMGHGVSHRGRALDRRRRTVLRSPQSPP
ncbi:MAG: hypothetical protein ABI882_07120 [Acidobacteriota bacterium]